MTLYWGGRRPADLYRDEIAQQWASEIPDFRYVPVVSEAQPEDQWTGRTGFVHQAVLEDFPRLGDFQVYACGAPVMVEAARRDFSALAGLPADEFFADAFTTAADEALLNGRPAGTA
jgi:CDP-4-dehydro-6-deoxyglucose reductase